MLKILLTFWQVILFLKFEHEYDPEPPLGNLISLPDSILTEVFLPEFMPFLESVLDLSLIHI